MHLQDSSFVVLSAAKAFWGIIEVYRVLLHFPNAGRLEFDPSLNFGNGAFVEIWQDPAGV